MVDMESWTVTCVVGSGLVRAEIDPMVDIESWGWLDKSGTVPRDEASFEDVGVFEDGIRVVLGVALEVAWVLVLDVALDVALNVLLEVAVCVTVLDNLAVCGSMECSRISMDWSMRSESWSLSDSGS